MMSTRHAPFSAAGGAQEGASHGNGSHNSDKRGATTFDRDTQSDKRSQATAEKSIGERNFDKAYTSGRPPWDIGEPQPAFVALADAGRITGKVLDVGCGTGENVFFLSQRGLDVLGLDVSSTAIAEARTKALARRVVARFLEGSALDRSGLPESFDTVIDSGLLHILSDADRVRLVAGSMLSFGLEVVSTCWPSTNTQRGRAPSPDSGRDPRHLRAGLGGRGD